MTTASYCQEAINKLDARLFNAEKVLFDMDLAFDQFELINSLIHHLNEMQEKMSIQSVSDYRRSFQRTYLVLDKLASQFAFLSNAAKQIFESKHKLLEKAA